MPDLLPISLIDQITEVEREVGMRVRVYKRRVEDGKMTQEKADRAIEVMSAVGLTLRWLQKNEAKIKAALGAALLLVSCGPAPAPAIYTYHAPRLCYVANGWCIPLSEPIERTQP